MAFMRPFYYQDAPWRVETDNGTCIVPSDLVSKNPTAEELLEYCDARKVLSFEHLMLGYIYRLSAPGYMDCTEWNYAETLPEAKTELESLYNCDPDTGEELE